MTTIDQFTGTPAAAFTAKLKSYGTISQIWAANGAAVSTTGLILAFFTAYEGMGLLFAAIGFMAGTVAVTLYLVQRGLRNMRVEQTLRNSAIVTQELEEFGIKLAADRPVRSREGEIIDSEVVRKELGREQKELTA